MWLLHITDMRPEHNQRADVFMDLTRINNHLTNLQLLKYCTYNGSVYVAATVHPVINYGHIVFYLGWLDQFVSHQIYGQILYSHRINN